METRYLLEAVQRAMLICELFDSARPEISRDELSELTGIPARSIGRIADTLVAHDLLVETTIGSLRLGPRWLTFAQIKQERLSLREIGEPIMRALRAELNETYILSTREGDSRLIVECLVSTQPIRRVSRAGDEHLLHVGSGGRAILSGLRDEEISAYLGRTELVNVGYDTVTDPRRIWADVKKTRRDGYLTARAEITSESFSCSSPIHSFAEAIVGSLTITLPLSRLDPVLRDRAVATVLRGAALISSALGYARGADHD